jgi:hypothetical protein
MAHIGDAAQARRGPGGRARPRHISRGLERKAALTIAIIALAAIAAPSAGPSQPAPEPASGGQEQTSLEQAPAILQSIAAAEANGDDVMVWELEEELLMLARRHSDDVRMVPILREIADKRWARLDNPAFLQWVCRDETFLPPCGPAPGTIHTRPRTIVAPPQGGRAYVELEAMNLWSDAIRILHSNKLYESAEIPELERRLISHGGCGALPRQAYIRLMAYNAVNAAPLLAQVMTLVEAADSDFVCSSPALSGASPERSARRSGALEAYQESYELLERKNVPPATIDAIFAPEIPIVLAPVPPAQAYPVPAAATASAAAGYIDVAFEITTDGQARNIEVLGATSSTTKAREQDLAAFIETALFRPRVVNGRIADSRVVWRYYW